MKKQMRLDRWEAGLLGSIAAISLLYITWCYGLWGRGNLVLQYLLQCECPVHSEPARYPDYVEVVIPACQDASITISPQGHLIQVDFKYILDLESGERVKTPSAKAINFLSDDLLLMDPLEFESKIFSIHSQTTYPVKWLIGGKNFPELEDGTFDPNAILPILREAQDVFVLGSTLVVFNSDSNNYKLAERDLMGETRDGVLTRQFLEENQIPYTLSFRRYYTGGPSHSGAFVMKNDGIYLASSNVRIVENYLPPTGEYSRAVGWHYDDHGVFLQPRVGYLVDFTLILDRIHYFWVPQPILLLKVPQEYLLSLPAYPNPNKSE